MLAPWLGLAPAAAGCGPPPDAAPPADDVPRWTLSEELRYATAADAPLTAVEALVPGDDGRVYIVDRGSAGVLAFGPDGAYERMLGREGAGPGEFRRVWRVGVVADTVWAIDSRLDRLSLFSPGGAFLGSTDVLREIELPEGLRSVTALARMDDGSVLIGAAPPASTQTPGGPRSAGEIFVFRALAGSALAAVDTLDVPHWSWEVRFRDGALFTRQPLSDAEILEPSPYGDGWAIVEQPQPASGEAAAYAVERFGPAGQAGFRREVRYPPAPTGEADVERALDTHGDVFERLVERGLFASRAEAREAFEETLYRPEYLPPVTSRGSGMATESVRIDDRGRVWVERRPKTVAGAPRLAGSALADGNQGHPGEGGRAGATHPEGTGESDPSVWDVVGPEGRVARAVVPPGSRLLAVRGDRAWGVVVDELDVPTVVRYRIVRR